MKRRARLSSPIFRIFDAQIKNCKLLKATMEDKQFFEYLLTKATQLFIDINCKIVAFVKKSEAVQSVGGMSNADCISTSLLHPEKNFRRPSISSTALENVIIDVKNWKKDCKTGSKIDWKWWCHSWRAVLLISRQNSPVFRKLQKSDPISLILDTSKEMPGDYTSVYSFWEVCQLRLSWKKSLN